MRLISKMEGIFHLISLTIPFCLLAEESSQIVLDQTASNCVAVKSGSTLYVHAFPMLEIRN